MAQLYLLRLTSVLLLAGSLACRANAPNPLSPSAGPGGAGAANADGSTLKVSAPTPTSPTGGTKLETRRPVLTFGNASGRFVASAFSYQVQLHDAAGNLVHEANVGQGSGGTTSNEVPADLNYETAYRWRARARLGDEAGPWSIVADFVTPDRPVTATSPDGSVGPPRSIDVNEALGIIRRIHDQLGYDLGSRSSREARVAFLWTAVAVLHFGHARFNPAGPDADWCVKDAGGGRPPSDDVLVRCSSRDAWDLIGGAGANGYSFHLDYLGRLSGEQNVYPPPRGALP